MPGVEVKDFGPIATGFIDLKPLTVFIGPNNAGKSYLALAIYSLSRALSHASPLLGVRRPREQHIRLDPQLKRRAVDAMKKQWPNALARRREAPLYRELPQEAQELVLSAVKQSMESVATSFAAELRRCYGTEVARMGRRGHGIEQAEFSVRLTDPSEDLVWGMQSSQGELFTTEWHSDLTELSLQPAHGMPWAFMIDEPDFYFQYLLDDYSLHISRQIGQAYYLPASRSGILLGHKTLASLIVGRSSLAWLQPMEIPTLPGVITDLIQALLLLGRQRKAHPKILEVVDFLEKQVTHGTLDVDATLDYPEILYTTNGDRYRLHEVSSMVSEMAPLILFLKYLIEPGNLFIIEEPESHLHPNNQRYVARAIAMLVSADVKVLVTTHSDFFIDQISNLLALSKVSRSRRTSRGYTVGDILHAESVAAYLFQAKANGSQIESLSATPDEGISTEAFASVHRELYDEAVILEHS